MNKIKNYKFFFQFLSPKRKFLAIVKYPQLKELEKRFRVYLGSATSNKKRPCIFWKHSDNNNEYYKIVFLTSSRKTPLSVNLEFCYDKKKRCGKGFVFYSNSYVFQTPDGKFLVIKLKGEELLSEFINCGACEDLEFLEKIEFKEF